MKGRGRVGHRDSGKRVMGRQRQKLELYCQRLRNRKLEAERGEKARKRSALEALERLALLILCFQTPDFQNCENINYCFKTAAL